MNVNVAAEDVGGDEMEMMGCSLTWLRRARLPCSGASPDENLTLRSKVGVKDSGIMAEGRSFALFSESTRELDAILMMLD